jgi:hypothetical protein
VLLHTRIDIIDAARGSLGAAPLMTESAPGADPHLRAFEAIAGYALSCYPWRFNTVVRRLSRLSQAPARYWAYQFEKPSDLLGSARAYYDSAEGKHPYMRVELLDGTIQTDAPDLWIHMDKRSAPDTWPSWFQEFMRQAMRCEMALSIREDTTLYKTLWAEVYGTPSEMRMGGLLGDCMTIDAQSSPSEVLGHGSNPLIDVRHGG